MNTKFEDIKYDLFENIISLPDDLLEEVDTENDDLYYLSLIASIAYVFKDSEIVNAVEETLDSLENPQDLTNSDVIKMKNLESEAVKKFEEYCRSKSINIDRLKSYKYLIRDMLIQIFDFLTKGVIYVSIHIKRYLKNLTFNEDGTINLKKTILRILKEPSQTLISRFEIACHYFLDKCIIINLYQSDKSEEEKKYFTSNPKFITDYSLYYWMWQIRGKRQLVTEARNFYSQSGGTWSRADLQNDVALLSIFHKAIEDNNESAVQHLWTNHISKMSGKYSMLSDALKLSFSSSSRINVCLYLLFQIQNNELDSLLKDVTYVILHNMIKNRRWLWVFIDVYAELEIYLSLQENEKLMYALIANERGHFPIEMDNSSAEFFFELLPINLQERMAENLSKLVS